MQNHTHTVRFNVHCKAYRNVARHFAEGFDTLGQAQQYAHERVVTDDHFSQAGYEIERVEMVRTIVDASC